MHDETTTLPADPSTLLREALDALDQLAGTEHYPSRSRAAKLLLLARVRLVTALTALEVQL